jgi:hypothetical protein
MDSEPLGRGIPPSVALRVSDDADAGQIADAMVATWRAVDAALAPIIGSHGVAALYQRSLFTTTGNHAWLAPLHGGVDGRIDLPALKAAFAEQRSADAHAAGNALMQTFHQLLESLVGTSLTERLLHPVWADPSTFPPQDASP